MHAALCLLRQLVHAVAVLHDKAPDVCHGAIGPERIVVTPNARLVLVEYVLGSAIEQLRYSNKQYWQGLRVPLPKSFGMPHLDRRTDITQVGATALALILGRPLADEEFPAQISDMTANALALSSDGALEPLPLPLRVWLQRALQIDSKTPFSSAPEAWAELDRVLHYSDPIAEIEALKVFLSRYHAVVGTGGPAPGPDAASTTRSRESSPVSPNRHLSTASCRHSPRRLRLRLLTRLCRPKSRFAVILFSRHPRRRCLRHRPLRQPRHQRRRSQRSRPQAGTRVLGEVHGDTVTRRAAAAAPAPVEQVRQSVAAKYPLSRFKLAAAAALLVGLTSAITLGALRYMAAPVAADGMGTLSVQTNPSGVSVDVDGQPRGVTPLTLSLSPGRHTLKLANEGNVRSMPITITAGGQVSQLIELPRASSLLGELQVRTEPAGAEVTVDGHVYGRSPLTVEGLAPGAHAVSSRTRLGSMTQEVKIESGTTASLVVPLSDTEECAGLGLDLGQRAEPLQIFEDSRLLGHEPERPHHGLRWTSRAR